MKLYYPRCPQCGAHNITVEAQIRAINVVLGYDGEDVWFDEHDLVQEQVTKLTCHDCEHSGKNVKPWLTDVKEEVI